MLNTDYSKSNVHANNSVAQNENSSSNQLKKVLVGSAVIVGVAATAFLAYNAYATYQGTNLVQWGDKQIDKCLEPVTLTIKDLNSGWGLSFTSYLFPRDMEACQKPFLEPLSFGGNVDQSINFLSNLSREFVKKLASKHACWPC